MRHLSGLDKLLLKLVFFTFSSRDAKCSMFHVVNVGFCIASHALIDFISTSNLSKYRHLRLLLSLCAPSAGSFVSVQREIVE